jgi:hypothetical protein
MRGATRIVRLVPGTDITDTVTDQYARRTEIDDDLGKLSASIAFFPLP